MNNDNNKTSAEPEEVTEVTEIPEATKEEVIEMLDEEQTQNAELLADLNNELRRIVDVKDELARLISVIEDINTDSYNLKSLKNQAKKAKTKTDFNSAEARVLIYQQMKDWEQQAPDVPFFEDLEEA